MVPPLSLMRVVESQISLLVTNLTKKSLKTASLECHQVRMYVSPTRTFSWSDFSLVFSLRFSTKLPRLTFVTGACLFIDIFVAAV